MSNYLTKLQIYLFIMKFNTIITIIALCTLTMTITAQSNTPKVYELMRNVSSVNISSDYSAMKVKKVKIKEYVEMKLNMDFTRFCNSVESIIIDSANEELDKMGMKIVEKNDSCDIEIKLMFTDTDPDGEHNVMVKLVHKPSDTLISTFDINSNGGNGDDFREMFMNGLLKTGKTLGKKLCKIKSTTDSTK